MSMPYKITTVYEQFKVVILVWQPRGLGKVLHWQHGRAHF